MDSQKTNICNTLREWFYNNCIIYTFHTKLATVSMLSYDIYDDINTWYSNMYSNHSTIPLTYPRIFWLPVKYWTIFSDFLSNIGLYFQSSCQILDYIFSLPVAKQIMEKCGVINTLCLNYILLVVRNIIGSRDDIFSFLKQSNMLVVIFPKD